MLCLARRGGEKEKRIFEKIAGQEKNFRAPGASKTKSSPRCPSNVHAGGKTLRKKKVREGKGARQASIKIRIEDANGKSGRRALKIKIDIGISDHHLQSGWKKEGTGRREPLSGG